MAWLFDVAVREGVCRLRRPDTRWLSTGFDGGASVGPVAYNVTVPEGWSRTDLSAYVDERLDRAGFSPSGPALLTGVDQRHARRARFGPVEAVATAGVSNPAALPIPEYPTARPTSDRGRSDRVRDPSDRVRDPSDESIDPDTTGSARGVGPGPGTVNVVVCTDRALPAGALANLVAVASEAKAATLLALAGVPGTTTDAVVVGCDPGGEPARFSGSATAVGRAARICVRDAVAASLASRDVDAGPPAVERAEYGSVAEGRAAVSPLGTVPTSDNVGSDDSR